MKWVYDIPLSLALAVSIIVTLIIIAGAHSNDINSYQEQIDQLNAEVLNYQAEIQQLQDLPKEEQPINIEIIIPEDAIQIELDAEAYLDKRNNIRAASNGAQYQTFEATAYTAFCNTGCIGITRTGIDVSETIHHDGKRIIAVDPEVVPLGSTVEVLLSDGTSFNASAQDTGGAIKGNRIDLLKATKDEAWKFGRQDVQLRILD